MGKKEQGVAEEAKYVRGWEEEAGCRREGRV
jgi:hypothetical protein